MVGSSAEFNIALPNATFLPQTGYQSLTGCGFLAAKNLDRGRPPRCGQQSEHTGVVPQHRYMLPAKGLGHTGHGMPTIP